MALSPGSLIRNGPGTSNANVLDRTDAGRPARVRVVADLFGKAFDATVDFHHDKAPDELRFSLVEARKLAALNGRFASSQVPAAPE